MAKLNLGLEETGPASALDIFDHIEGTLENLGVTGKRLQYHKTLLGSLTKLIQGKRLTGTDKPNIQRLSLYLRMLMANQSITMDHNLLLGLHRAMGDAIISPIPFLNLFLLEEFQGSLDTLKDILPKRIRSSLAAWAKIPWDESAANKVGFIRVDIKNDASDTQSRNSVAIYLQQQDIALIVSDAESGSDSNSGSGSVASEEEEEGGGSAVKRKAEGLEGVIEYAATREFVLDSSSGRWTLLKYTDTDHLQPIKKIKEHLKKLLNFLRGDRILKQLVLEMFPDFFCIDSRTLVYTKLAYMTQYNFFFNLWQMDHSVNSGSKSDVDPVDWLWESEVFGQAFSSFVSTQSGIPLADLVDDSNVFVVFQNAAPIKPEYQGRPLAEVATRYLHQHPQLLAKLLSVDVSHHKTEELLGFTRLIFLKSSLSENQKAEFETVFQTLEQIIDAEREARNKLRGVIIKYADELSVKRDDGRLILSPGDKTSRADEIERKLQEVKEQRDAVTAERDVLASTVDTITAERDKLLALLKERSADGDI